MKLTEMPREALVQFHAEMLEEYRRCQAKGLKLDMSRGKPEKKQLDLSNALLSLPTEDTCVCDGIDARNYGTMDGLPSCRAFFAEVLGVKKEEVFAAGSASLTLMYGVIAKAFTHGLLHSEKPWCKLDTVKFLCPVPGYDRHFTICQSFGIEMINIPMTANGPDMDLVEEAVKDPAVKGIWCVPKYSNPEGIIYSDETVARLAALKPAAPDFIIMWDNAYCVHEFAGEFIPFKDMLTECRNAGNPDMVIEFASTSKITFPGAGISCFACSEANMAYMKKLLNAECISFDKVNQLRHVQFLKNKEGVLAHMKKHAALMKPKFDLVVELLDKEIAPLGFASYHRPTGGYFVSLNTMAGCAKRTHQLMKEAGVVMTNAGATFPYGKDPDDANLRIAPSYPPLAELEEAMQVLCVCLKLAAAEKLLA
ncbi:MAG: aminotransferase class I/II-fold pyridoxal phosphate-dependent enzyme [Clostridia bacterium]|nr:aminotransferase class I/II-fold pyridoxal phosphate-dependent enzyme [Clostridia bacterium]